MIDNSDIPLPIDQLRCRVLVFAILDDATQQYEQITKGYVQLTADDDGSNHTIYSLEVKDQKTNQLLMRSNLTLQKNFGKQKGSIISWTDQQQPQYTELALSFEKDKQCDQFWRTICQKIGKSYLQICGGQRLQIPTSNNLNYILEKAKNNIDLVDYNIVHSKTFQEGLKKVFKQMKSNNDEMGLGMIARILHAIICPSYSSNAIQTLLTGENFYMLLELQQFKRNIKFRQIYQKKVGNLLKNKFNLPEQIFSKIQLSHRAIFYRQNVLQLSEQSQLESMMFMISKEAIVQIMSYLNRSKFLQKFVTQQDENPQIIKDKISLIHEALIMYQHITSEQIKATFRDNLFSGNILPFTKKQIQINNIKALEILYYITQIDRAKVLQYLVENFKANSTDNLLKTLMKKYMNQDQMRKPILFLIESMIVVFNQKKEAFDFFNGTFVYSIFSVSKDPKCILLLANLLLSHLQNSSALFTQFIKIKIFDKLASQYRNGTGLKTKSQQLQLLKLLKYIIIEQNNKKLLKNKQIEKSIIQAGFFDCCLMIYFKYSQKNNIISSSMLQNIKLIEKTDYSSFDEYLIKQYSQNQVLQKLLIPIKEKHIEFINKSKVMQKQRDYQQVQRMNHQTILQNQQQDSYLMNDQNQNLSNNIQLDHQKANQDRKTEGDKQQKQTYLQNLKRMMNQVADRQEDDIRNSQPRKIIKKNQYNQQPLIQFQLFDLPDINQFETTQHT